MQRGHIGGKVEIKGFEGVRKMIKKTKEKQATCIRFQSDGKTQKDSKIKETFIEFFEDIRALFVEVKGRSLNFISKTEQNMNKNCPFERSYILASPLHQSKSSVTCLKAGNLFFLKYREVLVADRKTEGLEARGRLWQTTVSQFQREGSCRSLPSNPELHECLQFITGCYKIEMYKCSK